MGSDYPVPRWKYVVTSYVAALIGNEDMNRNRWAVGCIGSKGCEYVGDTAKLRAVSTG